SDFLDPSGFTIACKAGYNDDPHHGHLDCGQFNLTWNDIPYVRDIGRMRYDEFYFNEERWEYPYASSKGHNLIFVNGEEQIPAKLKDQPWKQGIGGEILKFETSAKRDYVLMDPTHAYPGKELKRWRRNIVLDKPVTALVLDEVDAMPGSKIEARFFPAVASTPARSGREARAPLPNGVDYKLFRDHVLLSAHRNTLAMIPLVLENSCEIVEGKVPALPVTEDARLNWIPFLESVISAKTKTTVLATIFVPVNDQAEAESVVKTAKISQVNAARIEVSVERSGNVSRWFFEKEKDGLVLVK
ncbi:MAG: heparinase II/III family protein, partial [Ignavibacteriales bacterium]|nr:heparinase II/III family protein [Ignavibacteriales bacterium]